MTKEIRFFSWNVNGIRAVLRKNALQDFLATEKPDILCLQEVKAREEQVDFDFNEYEIFWNPAKRAGYAGTAILVKKDFLAEAKPRIVSFATLGDIGDLGELFELSEAEGRILVLEFDNFFLANVYTPNSKPDLSRLSLRETMWDSGFLKFLKELEKAKPVVVCGDFNAAHTEIDIARPKANRKSAGFTDEERKGIDNLVDAGFIDTFRSKNPDSIRYTWWSHWGNARENNVGWRIDYFFVSKNLAKNVKKAEIYEKTMGSDHCPVGIEMEI